MEYFCFESQMAAGSSNGGKTMAAGDGSDKDRKSDVGSKEVDDAEDSGNELHDTDDTDDDFDNDNEWDILH